MPDARVPVWVEPPRRRYQPLQMESFGRVFADALVAVGSREWFTRFLIDTGADFTILSAGDAEDLLVDDYQAIDFEHDPFRVVVGGIGGLMRCVAREADLAFRTEGGDAIDIRAPILVAERVYLPDGRRQAAPPSLLGRDILGRGALTLAWRSPAELELSNLPPTPSALR